MIWKAPWGSHIDLDKIVSVEFDGVHFRIYFQLMDNPVMVYFSYRRAKADVITKETESEVFKRWHDELIEAWQKHKSK